MARIRTHTPIVRRNLFFLPKFQLKSVIYLFVNQLRKINLTIMKIIPNDCNHSCNFNSFPLHKMEKVMEVLTSGLKINIWAVCQSLNSLTFQG